MLRISGRRQSRPSLFLLHVELIILEVIEGVHASDTRSDHSLVHVDLGKRRGIEQDDQDELTPELPPVRIVQVAEVT